MAKRKVINAFVEQKFVGFVASVTTADLEFLGGLAREGKMRSVIDRRYSLEETSAALEYVGSRRAGGRSLSPSTEFDRLRSQIDLHPAGSTAAATFEAAARTRAQGGRRLFAARYWRRDASLSAVRVAMRAAAVVEHRQLAADAAARVPSTVDR